MQEKYHYYEDLNNPTRVFRQEKGKEIIEEFVSGRWTIRKIQSLQHDHLSWLTSLQAKKKLKVLVK